MRIVILLSVLFTALNLFADPTPNEPIGVGVYVGSGGVKSSEATVDILQYGVMGQYMFPGWSAGSFLAGLRLNHEEIKLSRSNIDRTIKSNWVGPYGGFDFIWTHVDLMLALFYEWGYGSSFAIENKVAGGGHLSTNLSGGTRNGLLIDFGVKVYDHWRIFIGLESSLESFQSSGIKPGNSGVSQQDIDKFHNDLKKGYVSFNTKLGVMFQF